MIDIKDKTECCGCHACTMVCVRHCITMQADQEGFLYPVVDKDICTNCGLCEKVCPIINQNEQRKPLNVYAARNINEDIRYQSSSGGIFTILAEEVIKKGGVVFGARFNEHWNVVHDWTETIEGIADFRGSKYVQSTIGNTYREAKEFLQQDRYVLFSGTPCQIAGLKNFLRKKYDKLLTIDIVCHGVPSPLVWNIYLDEIRDHLAISRLTMIKDISFRNKRNGWKNYGFHLRYTSSEAHENSESTAKEEKELLQSSKQNVFMQGFLADLYLRPSCYACAVRSGKSHSDITIGDFWGIQKYYPEFDDDKGIGLILINSEKGKFAYDISGIHHIETTYEQGLFGNPCLEHSSVQPNDRKIFWQKFPINKFESVHQLCKKRTPSFAKRVLKKIKSMLSL